ncbi:MAG: DUF5005 domain-containing protein [Candidatus Cryptobacteroides sp.]
MRMLSTIMSACLMLAVLPSCSGSGEHQLPNGFEDGGSPAVKAEWTSNADTVFLSWSLIRNDVKFDTYRIYDKEGINDITLPASETSCELTHIPYNQRFPVKIALLAGNEEKTYLEVNLNIDGFDSWIASKIIPDSGSVTEGDGMYSIALPDGRSIFLMGDSYTGRVSGGRRVEGNHMYRNTYIVYDNGRASAICCANGENTSAAVPAGVTNEGQDWYWPGHGFVVDNRLFIFQELMYKAGEGSFGFAYRKTNLLEYSLPDIKLVKDSPIPFSSSDDTIHYGAAAMNDGEWLYIYAQVDIENDADPVTEVLVARTTVDKLLTSWEYWNGNGWSADKNAAVKLKGLDSVPVSSQFNVFKLDGKYVLLTQDKTFNSGKIYTFTSSNPWGPWSNRTLIYDIPDLGNSNWFTYNAMGHPQFKKDGMILVSFNVNTWEFSEQFSDVSSYRPRFFWVEKNTILN